MINNLCSLHLDINYLGLPNGEVENPKLLFLHRSFEKQAETVGTRSESQRTNIYRNEVNIESKKRNLIMIGKLCGVSIQSFAMVLKTAIRIPSVEPWNLISEGKADFIPKFLCSSTLTFLRLHKGLLEGAPLCYA